LQSIKKYNLFPHQPLMVRL